MWELRRGIYKGIVTVPIIKRIVDLVGISTSSRKQYLAKDKEALVTATIEMRVQFSARKDCRVLGQDLNRIVTELHVRRKKKVIKHHSTS
jgi:hypothetical protein